VVGRKHEKYAVKLPEKKKKKKDPSTPAAPRGHDEGEGVVRMCIQRKRRKPLG